MTGPHTAPRPRRGSPWLATSIATGAILGAIALIVWWRVRAGLHDPIVVHGTTHPGNGDPGDPTGMASAKLADVILRLVDKSGEPVSDTLVILDGEHGEENGDWTFSPAGGRTGDDGKVRFTSVPFGHWPLFLPDAKVTLERGRMLAVGSDDTLPGSTIEFDVPVTRSVAIFGRVIDSNAQPVPFVSLTLHLARDGEAPRQQTARTNDQGKFEFYLPNGPRPTVRAEVTTTQHRPVHGQSMTFDPGGTPIEIVVETVPNPTIG